MNFEVDIGVSARKNAKRKQKRRLRRRAGVPACALTRSVSASSPLPHFHSPREEVVKQGDHIVRLLQERLSETAAAQGDPLAFLAVEASREAVREGVRVLDKGHDDVLGGWGGGRGGMKFPQVSTLVFFVGGVAVDALLCASAIHYTCAALFFFQTSKRWR